MSFTNNGMKCSEISLNIPSEPSGTYRGSNEFILTGKNECSISEKLAVLTEKCRTKFKNSFRKKNLYKRLPILNWLPKYTMDDGIGDLVAGITVGLTVIPQALAYSGMAKLPPAFGLYGSFMGSFVYIIFGSCKDVPMGPTAIASLLTLQAANGIWQRAVLLAFLSGLIEISMGIFGLGFLIDFISGPVSSGFTSAAALIILTSQIKDIFGIKAAGDTFLQTWISIIQNIQDARLNDTILGFSCIFLLLMMRILTNVKFGPKDHSEQTSIQKFLNKFVWLLGTARNAILVIVTGSLAALFYQNDKSFWHLIGYIPPGLPDFQVPPFSIDEIRNETTNEIIQQGETFSQMISELGSSLIVVPMVALLENIAICKTFANGKPVDATQELFAIGISNVANSFAQGYPGTGALARGAVNNASGVRTPMGGLYTGIIVIVALQFLTPLFSFIPKASLAAIIIAAVIFMVEIKVIKPMWRSKKTDLIPGVAAFIACLVLHLEFGILVGIGLNIVFILYHAARPKIEIEHLSTNIGTKYLMLTPDRCLIFPSVDYVRNLINKEGLKTQITVVIDCTHIYGADFTTAKVIESLMKDFSLRNQKLIFYNLKPSVSQVFEGVYSDIPLQVYYQLESLERTIDANI